MHAPRLPTGYPPLVSHPVAVLLVPALALLACRPPASPPLAGPDTADGSAPTEPADTSDTARPPETVPGVVPIFQPERGLVWAPFDLTITTGVPGGAIRYTLDGTDPRGEAALDWPGSVHVDATSVVRAVVTLDGQALSSPTTHSYLFPDGVPDQAAPASYPTAWWTWYTEGGYPADYGMDPEITDSATYGPQFPGAFEALPSVSLVMDPEDLFGTMGIYERPMSDSDVFERAVSVEWIPLDGEPGFQVDAGIRVNGGASRDPACSPKKTFRLVFQSAYGPTKLEHPLFPGSGVESFDTLVLRAGYNLSWIHWSGTQRSQAQYRRDNFARTLQAAMGDLSTHHRVAHLYLNGLYWGIYTVHERPDASFLAATLGGTREEYDAINTGAAVDGDLEAWNTLMALVEEDLSDPAAWADVLTYLDVGNFADYMLLNYYLGNVDWPYNNWYAGRRRVEGAGFQFFTWDAEHILEDITTDMTSDGTSNSPGRLEQRLETSKEYRVLFGDRVQRFLFHGGPLTVASTVDTWGALGAVVDPAVVAESARWGDYRRDVNPYSEGPYELYTVNDHYVPENQRITEHYLPGRWDRVLSQLRQAGLYPTVDAPEILPWGGEIAVDQLVEMTAPAGTIYYTTDGSDPRLPGGEVGAAATVYDSPFPLTGSTTIQARALDGSRWSALASVGFTVK